MSKILICIPVHNRIKIAKACIPTVQHGMVIGLDTLTVYDDGSRENYDLGIVRYPDDRLIATDPIGIERQRKLHFQAFDPNKFTHLYLTDSDAIHDPNWRQFALDLQERTNHAPVCLYNTMAHVKLVGNTIEDDPKKDYILRRVAPGISYLLTAEHVAVIQKAIPHLPDHWHWDWTVPNLLGNMMVVSRLCHVDHIGFGGMHHPLDEGFGGGDRALNPTAWLAQKRAEVVEEISTFDYPFDD